MIGIDGTLPEIANNRLCRSGAPAEWRASWDRFDEMLGAALSAFQKSHGLPDLGIYSVRTNISQVSIIRNAQGWALSWDERFFDYIIIQLGLLHREFDENTRRVLTSWLLSYVGESYALSDPHYSLELFRAARSLYPPEGQRCAPSADALRWLEICFRVMRGFVLFHECAHIALKDRATREMEAKNLENLLDLLKRTAEHDRHTSSMGPAMVDRLIRDVLEAAGKDGPLEEMLADMLALKHVMNTELAAFRLWEPERAALDQEVAGLYSAIYEAMMLLYFITATMNSMQEWFRPKAITHSFRMDQFDSVSSLAARADIRGRFWQMLVADAFQHNLVKIGLIKKIKLGLRDLYLQTHLELVQRIQLGFDRRKLLRNTDDLRGELGQEQARVDAEVAYEFANEKTG